MKKILAIVLSLAMVVALAACGSSTTSTETTKTEEKATTAAAAAEATTAAGEELIQNETAEEADVVYPEINVINKDSVLSLYPWTSQVAACLCEVYEKLYDYDDYSGDVCAVLADASYDGNFLPGCDHEEGTGVYTVHIWDDIYDHAGNHLTADDVKFSWDFVAGNKTEGIDPHVDSNKGARAYYQGCKVFDETTIEFTFSQELTGLREFDDCFADFFVMTEAGFGGTTEEEGQANLSLAECGTGPYTLVEFTSGSVFSVKAYEDYWAKDHEQKCKLQWQNVEVINYLTLDDKAQQVTALETGDVDIIQDIAVDYLPLFQDGGEYADNFNVITYMQGGQITVSPNNSTGLMANQDLRLALFYATDNEAFVAAMGGEAYGIACTSLFGAGQPDKLAKWDEAENYNTVYDADLAKEYMTKAGYNGEKLVLCCQQSLGDAAQLLQTMWTAVGFNIELDICDQSTYNEHHNDAEAWDVCIANSAGYCGAVQVSRWAGISNATGLVSGDRVDNAEWVALMTKMNTLEGHNEETIDAWMQMAFDNAYDMGLATTYINNVANKCITSICRNGKNSFIPGGFTYTLD